MLASISELGFFVKLCCLSNESRYPGYVQAEYQKGMSHEQLASLMNMPQALFDEELAHQKSNGVHRVEEDEHGVIKILKWDTFQAIPSWDGNPDTAPDETEPDEREVGSTEFSKGVEERLEKHSKKEKGSTGGKYSHMVRGGRKVPKPGDYPEVKDM